MSSASFRFKQFSIAQNVGAMKVNTDGVLLGAWVPPAAQRILDIGTGTGVIAMMLAQRNSAAQIDAIEVDAGATDVATSNFIACPWGARLTAHHCALQQYMPNGRYDLIVSNPPYFVDDYPATDPQRNAARHSVSLSYEELIAGIARLLSDEGKAALVLPAFHVSLVASLAADADLHLIHHTSVRAVEGKSPYLALLLLSRVQQPLALDSLTIQQADGTYTEAYRALTADFYLKF